MRARARGRVLHLQVYSIVVRLLCQVFLQEIVLLLETSEVLGIHHAFSLLFAAECPPRLIKHTTYTQSNVKDDLCDP